MASPPGAPASMPSKYHSVSGGRRFPSTHPLGTVGKALPVDETVEMTLRAAHERMDVRQRALSRRTERGRRLCVACPDHDLDPRVGLSTSTFGLTRSQPGSLGRRW